MKTADQIYIYKVVRKPENQKILGSTKTSDCLIKKERWIEMVADINKVRANSLYYISVFYV
jgi:hypothetical protein